MGRPILVYGASVFGQVLRQLILDCGRPFAGFIDDWNKGAEILGTFSEVTARRPSDEYDVVLGIGYKHLAARRAVAARVRSLGYTLPVLIHPRSYVSATATLEQGGIVMATAVVDLSSAVGELCVLWPGAILNHHCVLKGNCFLSPGSIVCGNSHVGLDCFLGAGAIVTDHVTVPNESFLRAGRVYSSRSLFESTRAAYPERIADVD